eukprot:6031232-Pleurochrysis_carterae.AAC.5
MRAPQTLKGRASLRCLWYAALRPRRGLQHKMQPFLDRLDAFAPPIGVHIRTGNASLPCLSSLGLLNLLHKEYSSRCVSSVLTASFERWSEIVKKIVRNLYIRRTSAVVEAGLYVHASRAHKHALGDWERSATELLAENTFGATNYEKIH